jgi:hypothetical protein
VFADFDLDNDIDFIYGSESGEHFVAEQDENGDFLAPAEIADNDASAYLKQFNSSERIDIDSDGDMDVPPNSFSGRWFEYDGSGFVERTFPIDDWPLSFADIDSDGDLDVLTSESIQDGTMTVYWHENTSVLQYDSPKKLLEVGFSSVLRVVDVDNDSDPDIVLADTRQHVDGQVVVFENSSGVMAKTQSIELGEKQFAPPKVVDVDNDGQLDIVLPNYVMTDRGHEIRLDWLKNESGRFFAAEPLTTFVGYPYWPGDLDGNGLFDIVIIDRQPNIDLYRSTVTVGEIRFVGDSNADGRFNASDIVSVFVNGEYADGVGNNSSFDEGDWNGDGDFDSSDFVFAFQLGNFENTNVAAAMILSQTIDDLKEQRTR